MTTVVLFHHAQGLTDGVKAFAERLRGAGHTVTTPDLYDGETFEDLEEGIDHAGRIGFATIADRGRAAADDLPDDVVYAGFSLGAMPAQILAQTTPGAKGAILLSGCITPSELGSEWPVDLPVQIHGAEEDELFVDAGDLDAARAIVDAVPVAELYLYPGSGHLFADDSLPEYDEESAVLLEERVLRFLDDVA
ncbi:dienelactone hydrolase [Cellulomonas sp. PhB143]|nr:dienelactone hydrolase [Cellulomonas sp. PhB143]